MTTNRLSVRTSSPEETMAWAARWATALRPGTVIALHGDLGAGKTCFVRGLATGLGTTGHPHSPTFTLINEYPGPVPLYHLDLYRLAGEEEAWDLGIDQYLPGDGITAIEWADRIARILPPGTVHVHLNHGDEETERILHLEQPVPPC
jgi:tRNA threonylcarbamoyladenosine biosynthesis protein TsaE